MSLLFEVVTMADHENQLPEHLDQHICFALYSASNAMNRAYKPMLSRLDLTYPQYLVLTALWEKDGQSVGALGGALFLETNTLTPLLKRMESQKLVDRQRGKQDERQMFVHLTKKGKLLQKEAANITSCIIGATGEELEVLQNMVGRLHRMRDSLIDSTK